MIPVFTTTEPGFMGPGERNEEFIQAMQGQRRMIGFPVKRYLQLYIHGNLEREVGFDIPVWLSGDITTEARQPCQVWDLFGEKLYRATICLREGHPRHFDEPHFQKGYFWGGLITFPGEEEEYMG